MRRDITIAEVIEDLKKYPSGTKITVDTSKEVQFVGFVVKRNDGVKQIAEINVPKTKPGTE
jgi:hypothetical protein